MGQELRACRELSCSTYSLRGQAVGQGCLPGPYFTGPEAQPLRSWKQGPGVLCQGRASGDCIPWRECLLLGSAGSANGPPGVGSGLGFQKTPWPGGWLRSSVQEAQPCLRAGLVHATPRPGAPSGSGSFLGPLLFLPCAFSPPALSHGEEIVVALP